ncbi:MAG: nitroreductase family protein [Nitrososphaerota archaeon]|nr:nitroreductase family protein [Nitrososphaerota archaeon]
MEFNEVVMKRRMVRNFTADPVSDSDLKHILELALHAPSAGFSQGWSFLVVHDEGRRKEVGRIQGEKEYDVTGFGNFVSKAPILIVVCTSEDAYHKRYRESDKVNQDGSEIEWPTPYWIFDVGASTMIMLLAAVDLGYSAAFTGAPNTAGLEISGNTERVPSSGCNFYRTWRQR